MFHFMLNKYALKNDDIELRNGLQTRAMCKPKNIIIIIIIVIRS